MIREAISKVQELAVEAAGIQSLDFAQLRKIAVVEGDQVVWRDYAPELVRSQLGTFDDVVRAVQDKVLCPDPEVYYGPPGRIVVVCDRQDRHATIHAPLYSTDRWKFLKLIDEKPLTGDPKTVVRTLRLKLPDTGIESVVGALRRVTFRNRDEGGYVTDHKAESMGRQVEREVAQADDVPDEFEVEVAVWSNPGFASISRVRVRCLLNFEFKDNAVSIQPVADTIPDAEILAAKRLGEELRTALPEGTPIYQGTP